MVVKIEATRSMSLYGTIILALKFREVSSSKLHGKIHGVSAFFHRGIEILEKEIFIPYPALEKIEAGIEQTDI